MESLCSAYEPSHLTPAVVHYNEALQRRARGASSTDQAAVLFHCLNVLQSGMTERQQEAEGAAFTRLVRMGTSARDALERYLGPELQALGDLRPRVLDHNILRDHGHRPNAPISPSLERSASAKHRKLDNALEDWCSRGSDEALERVVKRSAELLYVVRCNIAHGEKTPYGPDVARQARDEAVCRAVVPVQLLLVDLLLGGPSEKLVVYGTLAPGEPNHSIVEPLGGSWSPCEIHGALTTRHGLPVFTWQPMSGTPTTPAMLLVSARLPCAWPDLDAFEGSSYRRELTVALDSQSHDAPALFVASIYVDQP